MCAFAYFAEEIVGGNKTVAGSPRYSVPVELDPANLPAKAGVCVSSKELFEASVTGLRA
jgi:hypothetical protein